MAITPFTTATVPVAGAWPGRVRDQVPAMRRYWLGRPGNLIELPAPKVGREVTISSGESPHTSLGGTSSTFRRVGPVKRRFVLEWDRLAGRDWQVVYGFYRRVFGVGPWAFLPPEDINRLTEAASLCAASAWGRTGTATLTSDTAVSPVLPSGVLRWTAPASGDILFAQNYNNGAPVVTRAIPYLPAAALTVSLWAWTATGTRNATLRAAGLTSAGASATNVDQAVTLTTTPQRLTLTVPAGNLNASVYAALALVAGSGSADVLVAAPQLEYGSAATDWTLGMGVPRVVWTDPPGDTLDARYRSATTMTLAE